MDRSRTNSALLVVLQRSERVPLHRQIATSIRDSIRAGLASAPNDVFGYLAGSGVPQLRTAVADYLNRVRGTLAQPDNIVISAGYAQGIALLIQVLAAAGAKRVALEDPSSGDDALPA